MAKSRPTTRPRRIDTGGGETLAGRGALFLFDRALALDAVARERQRLQTLLRDRLATALAVAEAALTDLLQGQHDLFQEPPVTVAQLEEKLAIVGRGGLVAQVLDGVVLGPLPVEHVPTHFLHELAVLLLQLLAVVDQAIFLHRALLAARRFAASRAGYHGVPVNAIPRASALHRHERRVAPQTLERVEATRLVEKDVHHHVAVVEQEPAALRAPLVVARSHPLRAQRAADRLRDGVGLRGGAGAADEEVVGDARQALQVEHRQIDRLLLQRRVSGGTDDGFRGQGGHHASGR